MKTNVLFLTIYLLGALCLASPAAQANAPESIFEHLTSDEGTPVALTLDLSGFIAQKRSNDYFPATLQTAGGMAYDVEVRARGRYRRMNAEVPPFKIKFRKKDLFARGLDSLNEIKVVLPMKAGSEGDELVVKEYLAYRMFEQITGTGIRARLVSLTLTDTRTPKSKPRKCLAIFLEDEEEAAARLGGSLVEQYGIGPGQLDPNQAAAVTLFQYMIGNTDWDFEMQRNIRFVQLPGNAEILALPYDFDFSGLVNAPYASPESKTGLRDVRERLLLSGNLPAEALSAARTLFLEKKTAVYEACRSGFLSKNTQAQTIKYLNRFFSQLEEKAEIPVRM